MMVFSIMFVKFQQILFFYLKFVLYLMCSDKGTYATPLEMMKIIVLSR